MNKTALRNFAIYARNRLIQEITNKASRLGISEKGIEGPLSQNGDMYTFDIGAIEPYKIYGDDIEKYNRLVRELETRAKFSDYKTAYDGLIEEVAYTWFNRIIAIRFMEINNYLPDRMRVLSSGREGVREPEFVTYYYDTSLDFTDKELEDLESWRADGSSISMDKMFQLLFIKQCNALNDNLPELFQKTNDYAELLLTISYNDPDGIVYRLVHDIDEEYFDIESNDGNGQVEIIGWLYQYYNTERKDEVFSRPGSTKIQKDDIPPATQLFTPDWIVRYMVENSLGRLWIEKLLASGDDRSEKEIAEEFGWEYYIPEAEQTKEVAEKLRAIREERKKLQLEDIKFMDPAMGSFHIGIYAFEVFMQLYESQGYTARDASRLIIENNLYGLEIDKRAYQLSYFACMMKGRQYSRRILNRDTKNNLYAIPESNNINRKHLEFLGKDIEDEETRKEYIKDIEEILDIFIDGREYGSILKVSNEYDFEALKKFVINSSLEAQVSFDSEGIENTREDLLEILSVAQLLAQKYDVVSTNPPYMGSGGMNVKLSKYVKKNYPDSKADLFAVFMEATNKMLQTDGLLSLVTMQSWMFLSSYEKLRRSLLKSNMIIQLMHMNNMVMRIAFGTAVTIFKKRNIRRYLGTYHMVKYEDLSREGKPKVFPKKDYRYNITAQDNFEKIPGMPVAYWASNKIIEAFEKGKPLNSLIEPRQGLITADTNRFLRLWYEVDINKICFEADSISLSVESKARWFPYNKGGARRQWYGNYDYVVNWGNDGFEIRNFKDARGRLRSRPQNTAYYFKEAITWSLITSGGFSIRYREPGSIHDVAGMSAFTNNHDRLMYILGIMSTKISNYIFKMLNPTINLPIGDFNNFPILLSDNQKVLQIVKENILISKREWNSYEEAWGFKVHPILEYYRGSTLRGSFKQWEEYRTKAINRLRENEQKLNEIFISLYKLEDELTPNVSFEDITLRTADLTRDIKSFISYGVGCIFGRYSLDVEGLAYAGGEWDGSKYTSFKPVKDNIILITDEDYYTEDITSKFIEFVETAFDAEHLEENLEFIGQALGGKGDSREVIRNYFLKDFYKDHVKTYKKRPIYWLYDSGRQNGFKALIYMHRYNEDTTGKVRVDYLHELQKIYERNIDNLKEEIVHNKNPREVTKIERRLQKLTKQLDECKKYDERIAHLALRRISIDLDDGVKVNYDKVQLDENNKNLKILARI